MDTLVPIMVRTFGRTGSTLLMQILGSNDQICFERQYPFEHRYLAYVFNSSRVMSLKAKVGEPWDNDTLFRGKERMLGCLPYGEVKLLDRDQLSKKSFVALWNVFSEEMRERSGLKSGVQGYYAEKTPPNIVNTANELLLAKNIFLLRDPRDEMVSIKSFNSKRGFNSFGWLDEDDDVSYAHKMCRNRQNFMRNMIDFEENSRRIAIRYEDLIKNEQVEVERLSNWLGLPLNTKGISRDKTIRKIHMTSSNPQKSVERWREELSGEVQDIFAKQIGDELTQLGYAV